MTHTLKRTMTVALLVIVPALLVLGGCRNNAQTGALIGAAAGATGGYIIGNETDKDRH